MKNNKLIAEFMGYPHMTDAVDNRTVAYYVGGSIMNINNTHNENEDDVFHPDDMQFHTSWDWLMPVVEKINDTERYEVCIGDSHCHITDIENDNYKVRALTLSLQGKTTIEATHLAVVEFIKWYNDGKQ